MATLVIVQGPESGKQFPLDSGSSLIGRQPDAPVFLEALAVSRQHAQIVREDETFYIEDVGSSNGTFLNGKPVSGRTDLTEHDTVQIGPYLLVLRPDPPEPPSDTGSDPAIRVQVSATPSNHTIYAQNPAHKLQVVLEIAQHLARTLEVQPLLGKLLDQLLRLFPQADRGLALLGDGDRFEVQVQRERDSNSTLGTSFSRTLVQRALREGVGILSEDVPGDQRLLKTATLVALKLRSLVCVPVICQDGRRLGVIQLDCFRSHVRFRMEDLELLAAIALQVAVVLDNAALHSERLREERLHQELALAREIQQGFLPTDFRPLGPSGYELHARVYPARQVSGDLYDFFALPDGRLAFYVGDVSGKGMPAALFMIAVRTLGRNLATYGSPAESLRKLNAALAADNPSAMFVTLAQGIYDPRGGEVVLASGGHPHPLLRRIDGTVEETPLRNGRLLGYQGLDLGLTDYRFTLAPGETLILYTDGFTEAIAPDRKTLFGKDRLRETLSGSRTALSLEACAEEARTAVQAFTGKQELQDDLTLLLLRHGSL
jgi:serine phosphatase RsbU (regulator of sigma subunit)/pSer/pThr/pTyr-binding forkhead associated (FHA) protein